MSGACMSNEPKKSWIIGASSGIGAALAEQLAEKGEVLCLSARSEQKLVDLQQKLPIAGDMCHLSLPCDVADHQQIHEAVNHLKKAWQRIDRVIFMAGLYDPATLDDLEPQVIHKIIDVNLKAVFFLLYEILPVMKRQKSGQIVLCASVAGYRGLPNAQPYGASKAAMINLAETLRAEKGHELDIKVINPGFVESHLTEKNNFHMPMKISAQQAAASIVRDLDRKKFEIHFPKRFTYLMKLLQILPYGLYFRMVKKR